MSMMCYQGKNVYYSAIGKGTPVILIHGNTASGKMFFSVPKKLSKHFRVIFIDLPGHGRSERLEKLPRDFWYENALVIIALIEHLGLDQVHLIGSSGGAQIALNVGLERPDLVYSIIADSFEGAESLAEFADHIFENRQRDQQKFIARCFWWMMHGRNWKTIVNQDSQMIFEHHHNIGKFFHNDLSTLECPTLLTGTLEDEFIHNIDVIYDVLSKAIPNCRIHIFQHGGHPAVWSNQKEFLNIGILFMQSAEVVAT